MRPRLVALGVVAGAGAAAAGAVLWPDSSAGPAALRVSVANDGHVSDIATATPVGPARAVTVAHVLADGGSVRVAGREARVVRTSRRLDLALLAVPGLRASAAPVATAPDPGSDVIVRVVRDGRTADLRARLQRAVVARVKRAAGQTRTDARPALELAATVAPGDSGAPVADGDGRLVGIVFARSSRDEGTAWAIDARALSGLLSDRTGVRPDGPAHGAGRYGWPHQSHASRLSRERIAEGIREGPCVHTPQPRWRPSPWGPQRRPRRRP